MKDRHWSSASRKRAHSVGWLFHISEQLARLQKSLSYLSRGLDWIGGTFFWSFFLTGWKGKAIMCAGPLVKKPFVLPVLITSGILPPDRKTTNTLDPKCLSEHSSSANAVLLFSHEQNLMIISITEV